MGDVEGAEWGVLEQWHRDNVWPQVGQLLLEVHMWDRGASQGGLSRWAAALDAIPMRVFHTAKNENSQDSVYVGLTSVWELAFVNNELGTPSSRSPRRQLQQMSFSDLNNGVRLSDIVQDAYHGED